MNIESIKTKKQIFKKYNSIFLNVLTIVLY